MMYMRYIPKIAALSVSTFILIGAAQSAVPEQVQVRDAAVKVLVKPPFIPGTKLRLSYGDEYPFPKECLDPDEDYYQYCLDAYPDIFIPYDNGWYFFNPWGVVQYWSRPWGGYWHGQWYGRKHHHGQHRKYDGHSGGGHHIDHRGSHHSAHRSGHHHGGRRH